MGAAAETASSASSASMAPVFPLGAQFWAHVREPGRPARQVLRQVEGGERGPCISESHELHPAGLARPRPPSLACGAAGEQLAGNQWDGSRPPQALGQHGVGAKQGKRLGVGAQGNHGFSGRNRDDRRRPAARPRLPQQGGEVCGPVRVERRLQLGRDRREALRAERVARPREGAEGGVDPPRRPEVLAGPGEGDRVPDRRLVLAPVEQVLRCPRRRF